MYSDALDKAKEEYFEESKHGKPLRRIRYVCAGCDRRFREHLVIKDGQTPADAGIILPDKSTQHKKKKFKMIAVDHINPIIDPEVGFTTWDDYISKLYFGKLQILCNYPGLMDGKESCHSMKTKAERSQLADTKRNNKQKKGKS